MGKKDKAVKLAWDAARLVVRAEIVARLCRSSCLNKQWVPQKDVVPAGFTVNQCKGLWKGGRSSLDARGCLVYTVEGAGGKQYACVQRWGKRQKRWIMALERDARAAGEDGTLCALALEIPYAEPT